jgi:hypothetical protein
MNILPMEIWREIFAQGLLGSDSDIIQGSQFLCNLRLICRKSCSFIESDYMWRELLRILNLSYSTKFEKARDQIRSLVEKYELNVSVSQTGGGGYMPYVYGSNSYFVTIRPYWTLQQVQEKISNTIKELMGKNIIMTIISASEGLFISIIVPKVDVPLYSQLDFNTRIHVSVTIIANEGELSADFFR